MFSGGADGYIRMYNWVETANGKVPLTVAQKHPFVDSVMKAGSLTTYWENEESSVRTPPRQSAEEPKDLSPVYSLAVHHQAVWLLSGLESGGINLQTCRHQAGTRIATLREHTSAVSVLNLAQDESSFLSGSWDKVIHEWDMNVGKVKRSFRGSGGQISAIERRPESNLPVPVISEEQALSNTFSSNNTDKPTTNGSLFSVPPPAERRGSKNTENGTEDAQASPDGSLFGDDSGSLFGDNDDTANAGGAGNNDFDDDEFSKAIANDMQQEADDAARSQNNDVDMSDATMSGGPVQPPDDALPASVSEPEPAETNDATATEDGTTAPAPVDSDTTATLSNGLPHSEDIYQPPSVNGTTTDPPAPPQTSETTFLSTSIDGTLLLWDRRASAPISRILPPRGTPPWCLSACWSPDGNNIYVGRRNQTVEEYSLHKGLSMSIPSRVLRFPSESKAVSAVKMMPNGRHMVVASYDILRLYDLKFEEEQLALKGTRGGAAGGAKMPFLIIPGHRTGVVSALHIDPQCRFMISIAGNRGWEGASTETLLGYEINIPSTS